MKSREREVVFVGFVLNPEVVSSLLFVLRILISDPPDDPPFDFFAAIDSSLHKVSGAGKGLLSDGVKVRTLVHGLKRHSAAAFVLGSVLGCVSLK